MSSLLNIINREYFLVNKFGILKFDQCNLMQLAKKYGTPLYIYSENIIREKCKTYTDAFSNRKVDFEILYAGKAFLVKAMCDILNQEGLSLDVSSGGELYTALSSGFPSDKIYLHGNNKSKSEIEFALKEKIGTIIVDNENELDLIEQIASRVDTKIKIMLRVTPGVDTHTHKYIQTGQIDSKFGINIKNVPDFVNKILLKKNLIYSGLHCHLGSQIFDLSCYILAIKEMTKITKDVKTFCGVNTPKINLGGGLGIKYTESDEPPSINNFVQR